MLQRIFLFILFSHFSFSLLAQIQPDSSRVLQRLEYLMENQKIYVKNREDKLEKLKQEAKALEANSVQFLKKNYEIFENYKKFDSDAALSYILLCQKLAPLNNDSLQTVIHLDLAWVYSTIGRYIEASKLLGAVEPSLLGKDLLAKYYDAYSSFYSHYGQSNNRPEYYQASERYRDSLLTVLPKSSLEYRTAIAIKTLFNGNREDAKKQLLVLWQENKRDIEQRALIAYFLGLIYKYEKDTKSQIYYLSISASADIEMANRDNASFHDLALTYYDRQDFDRAFQFIEKAIDDAMLCKVRYRIIEGTSSYPIINAAYQQKISSQNRQLVALVVVVSILLIGVIIGLVIIYRQVQHLRRIRSELSATNQQLRALNNEINQTNFKLSESNHIKEEYIAQFFDMCSNYIDKMEDIRKVLLKKATNQQWDALREQLKSTQMEEREVQQLYVNFDRIFLNLYPTFVDEFNALLQDDEKIYPKKTELLNTELRIFALIRLGIDDSVKIASFLRYSLRTVYNYRTKVRNKAAGNRDAFEAAVCQIAVIDRP
ncbi:MAG: DUF6377 domain-containing protein [Sphingobacterium sp.]|jgi:DNA-binding CsgD family transcriptional regulator/biopolymer transport protein ExbB/TolQ|uniref:DUF6377 domain-containing protein n=1 Tax=Sphingobacterium sp. TaxID=341027 RepID=UPI002841A035|nr:DUF6377 domain-containing protein [Sphingobacterium sp.]MDR3006625.1 DUF6377 domain-containing protein [Sphingobacterium sp.]